MKTHRAVWILPLIAGSSALILVGPAGTSAELCESSTRTTTASSAASSATEAMVGSGVAEVSEDDIVVIDQLGNRRAYQHDGTEVGVLRHASAAAGLGTVYVNDVAGQDIVTAMTPRGMVEHPVSGEASHPTWSPGGEVVFAEGFEALRMWSPITGALETVERPAGTVAVFSPLFRSSSELVAVGREPYEYGPPEDDGLDNLYGYDVATGTWSRLTSFTASADQWSVIRTPILDRDGSVLFVRVRGSGELTQDPSFELWRYRDAMAFKVRNLPGERFLAGVIDAGLLWNVDEGGIWKTFLEQDRSFRHVGCGGAMVDPRDQPDPDIAEVDRQTEPSTVAPVPAGPKMGIAVGDFASRAGATSVVADLGLGGLIVVDHQAAPFAVAPGSYAVVRPFVEGEDMEAALGSFRERFPRYAERSWIVLLAGGGSGEE